VQLHERYASLGLNVLAFPSNQFGQQEPKSNAEIKQFVTSRFDVKFPLFAKIDVNGANAHPLFTWLKMQLGGGDIKWNFEKMLVNRRGVPVKRYPTSTAPLDIEADIVTLLEEPDPSSSSLSP
jgi:glutathione peroxidase